MSANNVTVYNPFRLAQNPSILWSIQGVQHPWLSAVSTGLYSIYSWCILRNLARLYLYGPDLNGIGFWQGRTPAAICAHLTPNTEAFWERNLDECQDMIATRFHSGIVLLETVVYFLILFRLMWLSVRWCCHRLFSTEKPLKKM